MPTAQLDPLQHWDAMIRVCSPIVRCPQDAEDCAAQVVLQVLAKPDREVDNLQALMVSMAKRRAVDMVRAAGRRGVRDRLLGKTTVLTVDDASEEVLDRAEAAWLRQATETLSHTRRRLVLMLADGHDLDEIAESLGLTRRAAESQLYEARRVLRRLHAATLGVVASACAGLRRFLLPAAPVVVVAAAMVVSGSAASLWPHGSAPYAGGQVSSSQAAATSSSKRALPQATDRHQKAVAGTHASQAGAARHAVAHAGSRRTLVSQRDPAGSTRVEYRDNGGNETGPVEVITACLNNFRLDPSHIGC